MQPDHREFSSSAAQASADKARARRIGATSAAPPSGQWLHFFAGNSQGFPQNPQITDVIGKDQDQACVEDFAWCIRPVAMGIDQCLMEVIAGATGAQVALARLAKIRFGIECWHPHLSGVAGGARQRRPDQLAVDLASARADVLIRPTQVRGAISGIVTLDRTTATILDDPQACRCHSATRRQQQDGDLNCRSSATRSRWPIVFCLAHSAAGS